MRYRLFWIITLVVIFHLSAWSQTIDGVITGRVEDTSGARIPGVDITLRSPAIQGARMMVSDESGNYRYTNLPPGIYSVTFELPGFSTFVRDGIIVEVGRTTTVNVRLEVATVAETVTVTGDSPVVDLEQAKIGVNFNSELKDKVVNARNYWALLAVTPGIRTLTPDVGGSTMGTQVGYIAYGLRGQVQVSLDGVNLTEGNGSGSMYGDYGSWEEVQVSAAGNSAEMNTAGTAVVAVVRSGGNQFNGGIYVGYEDSSFQGSNIDDRLRNLGISQGDQFTRYTDFNADIGGPIKRDRFWFYTSFRNEYSGLATEMRKNDGLRYVLPASGIAPPLCSQLSCIGDNPDGAERGGLFYTRLRNLTEKLTFQINPLNQLVATANIRHKFQPFRGGSGSSARYRTPDTTYRQDSWFHTFKAQWISTLSNRTTLDVSVNNFGYYWPNSANTEGPRIYDRGSSGATRRYEQGAWHKTANNRRRWHENTVLSHFFDGLGGNHNIKAGYAIQWEDQRYSDRGYEGHLRYIFSNGRPNRMEVFNTPRQWTQEGLLQNYFYIQDKWTLGTRLTLNLGFRFDRYRNFLPEQVRESAGGNPFNAATDITGLETFDNRRFEKRDIATFNNPVPRFSFVYDIFGDGNTALKASYGRFSWNPSETLSSDANDNGGKTAIYTWNGTLPFTVDYLRSCMADGSCRILSRPNLTLTRIDPNLKNAHITEYMVGLDQQVFGDWQIRANWVRKIEEGRFDEINEAYAITDYRPFQTQDPGRDGVLWTDDDQIVTAYERAVSTRPSDPVVRFAEGAGNRYTTFELEAVKRMSDGWQVITGVDWTNSLSGASFFTTDPNTLITQNELGRSDYWSWTHKFVIQADLPFGLNAASVLKSQSGLGTVREFRVSCTEVRMPGQSCSQAGGSSPRQGSFDRLVELSDTPSNFLPTITLWDISIGKSFNMETFGEVRATFDLFNITNANTIRSWETDTGTTTDPSGAVVPTFHRPELILNPRIFRLGLKWQF
ncbi:MAG: TonB-dependent receptor [Acidobacteria bacterium]|nr:TonB-dependent receptor [Acidobacteriota bacterium]